MRISRASRDCLCFIRSVDSVGRNSRLPTKFGRLQRQPEYFSLSLKSALFANVDPFLRVFHSCRVSTIFALKTAFFLLHSFFVLLVVFVSVLSPCSYTSFANATRVRIFTFVVVQQALAQILTCEKRGTRNSECAGGKGCYMVTRRIRNALARFPHYQEKKKYTQRGRALL